VTFVGGVPRSGTTLIHAVLCSTGQTNPAVAEDRVLRHIALSHEECDAQFEHHVHVVFPDRPALDRFHRSQIDSYLVHLRGRWPEAAHLVLKQPMLTINFPTLARLLPDARFVVVLRDPRAIVASLAEVDRRQQAEHGKPLFGGNMEAYLSLIDAYYRPSITFFTGAARGRCTWLRYEDFVRAPREMAGSLGAATGIDLSSYDPEHPWRGWHDGTTSREERRRWSTYAENWGGPVAAERAETWRRRLRAEDQATIATRLAPLMQAFGYEPGARGDRPRPGLQLP